MKWNNNILKENDVLIAQWHCKSRNDASEDVEYFCSTIKLVGLVDKTEEALVDCLSDHLAARNKLLKIIKNSCLPLHKVYVGCSSSSHAQLILLSQRAPRNPEQTKE